MSSAPRFTHQVFISYAHLDNRTPPSLAEGWVSTFHESLKVYLGELLGSEPLIWRDQKMSGNDYITSSIINTLSGTAVIVSIVSPRYIKSEWCLREAQEFCRAAEAHGGLEIGDSARIFKVLKLPIKNELRFFKDRESFEFYEKNFHDLGGYEFYLIKDERIQPFRLELGPESTQNYLAKVGDLAQDIAKMLEALEEQTEEEEREADEKEEITVYLAETTPDLTIRRDNIKRELLERKYKVLPDKPLPMQSDAFKAAVRAALGRSKLSIHLIGEKYGDCPQGEFRSLVELQNVLAAERDNDPAFSRLIWMPPELKPKEIPHRVKEFRQRLFIKRLLDSNSEGITELLQVSLEDLKTVIQDKITAPPQPKTIRLKRRGSQLVYVVCDSRDAEQGEQLRQLLSSQDYEVALPSLEGDEAGLREEHDSYLRMCDAVLIYWGNAPAFWLRLKLQDLQKSFGEGRSEPFAMKAIYAGSPPTREKENFLTNEALYIKNFEEEITLESLSPFFQVTDEEAEGGIA